MLFQVFTKSDTKFVLTDATQGIAGYFDGTQLFVPAKQNNQDGILVVGLKESKFIPIGEKVLAVLPGNTALVLDNEGNVKVIRFVIQGMGAAIEDLASVKAGGGAYVFVSRRFVSGFSADGKGWALFSDGSKWQSVENVDGIPVRYDDSLVVSRHENGRIELIKGGTVVWSNEVNCDFAIAFEEGNYVCFSGDEVTAYSAGKEVLTVKSVESMLIDPQEELIAVEDPNGGVIIDLRNGKTEDVPEASDLAALYALFGTPIGRIPIVSELIKLYESIPLPDEVKLTLLILALSLIVDIIRSLAVKKDKACVCNCNCK